MDNNVFDTEIEETQETEVVTEATEATEAPVNVIEATLAKVKALPKIIWIAAGAVVAAALVAIILISVLSNTYKTPVNIMQDMANTKKISDMGKYSVQVLNGFAEDEVMKIYKIMMKSEDMQDMMDSQLEAMQDEIDDMKDEYGDNYKYTYKIDEKEELEKEDLRAFRDSIKAYASSLETIIEETEDYDSDEWEDMADAIGLTKSQAKDLVKAMKELQKELKSVKVDKGYELQITVTLKGSELDEPEEEEMELRVYKVNGKWISEEALSALSVGGF